MRLDEAIRTAGATTKRLDQRTLSRLSVIGAIVLVASVVAVYGIVQGTASGSALVGADLHGTPAPGFTLADQNGAAVSLRGLRGHPVALAFMYTHCPDVCPLTAEKMHLAAQQLGSQASAVAWIGISVDPSGDTPEAARQFVATHELTGRLRFLLGSREQLAPVWKSYFLISSAGDVPNNQPAGHTGAVYLIDQQGRERMYLDSSFDPVKGLANDLRILLRT